MAVVFWRNHGESDHAHRRTAKRACTINEILDFIGPHRGECRVMLDLPNDGALHAVNSLQMRMDLNGEFLIVLSAKSIRQ